MSAQKWVIAGLAIVCFTGVQAETVTNNLDVQGGFIYNHGIVNPGDIGQTFTNAGIRDITISAGQLSGVDPVTGEVITNSANLLPLKAQSLTATGDIVAGGSFVGNGSGLTNLPVQAQVDALLAGISNSPAAAITIDQMNTWDAGADLAEHIQASAGAVTIDTNLTVQGTITGDGSGLTKVAAGGSDGQVQYNSGGTLAGYTNLFVHPVGGGLTVREQSGYFLRMYNSETLTDTNLIVSLRNESGTSVLRLRKNNQDNMVLKGDGSLTLGGVTRTNWPSSSEGSVSWTNLTGVPAGFADGVDNQATETEIAALGFAKTSALPTEAQVDDMVANNGYATQTQVSNHEDRILPLESASTAQASRITSLESSATTLTSDLGTLTSNVAGHTARIASLEAQTNLLAQEQIIIGSPEFVQQTLSNAVTDSLIVEGVIRGDGSGLTNLNISSSSLPTSGVWNVAGMTITNATLAGQVFVSSLNVDSISGNGAGLTNVAAVAGGSDGQVQYNSGGTLAGYTNLFVHPVGGGLTVREQSGYFLRMYNSETLTDTNLIVSLRNESGTSFFRLRQNNQDNIVFKGDGSASVKSLTLGGVTHTEWPVVASGNFVDKDAATNVLTGKMTVQGAFTALYIPPRGDIGMGSYTNGLPQ